MNRRLESARNALEVFGVGSIRSRHGCVSLSGFWQISLLLVLKIPTLFHAGARRQTGGVIRSKWRGNRCTGSRCRRVWGRDSVAFSLLLGGSSGYGLLTPDYSC